jgi:hypothetical protein
MATSDGIAWLVRRRMRNQLLSTSGDRACQEIVGRLGAVQAQDYAGGKWGIGLRGRALTDAAIERGFNDGAILRTHVLRPTWHFVAAADIRWMLALTGPRIIASISNHAARAAGLDRASFTRGCAALERALLDGRTLTRSQLAPFLDHAGLAATGLRLAYLLMYAELEGLICSGPRRGKQMTYALLEERAPSACVMRGDEALGALTSRFFSSHGPATDADFSWWSGLTLREARRGIQIAGPSLVREEIGGQNYWHVPAASPRGRRPVARLLPNYDEYVVAYRDRLPLLDGTHPPRAGRSAVIFANTVLVDGRIIGTWRRTPLNNGTLVTVRRSRRWTTVERDAVKQAGDAYAAFLAMPVSLTFE